MDKFPIVFTKLVVFKDQSGAIRNIFEVGDVIFSSLAMEDAYYFVCVPGGIWMDEARRVQPDEIISYEQQDGVRIEQRAGDPVPVWAANIRLEQK